MLASSTRQSRRLAAKVASTGQIFRQSQPIHSRQFTESSQLLFSRPSVRPQLAHLYAYTRHVSPLQRHAIRMLSTKTKQTIKDTIGGAIRLTIYWWTAVALATIAWMGWKHEEQEKKSPTPPEWSFWTKFYFREAKEKQFPHQLAGLEIPDWTYVATNMKKAIDRLEYQYGDGAGIRSALGEGEGAILVEGVGKTGADITGKSEPWRRGYFQALMTAGLAAEKLEGVVKDLTRPGDAFPAEVIIGPSNPTPRPMAIVKGVIPDAPKEEDCVPYFEEPQAFYMKVLTTTGFSNDQKMQAALAYADWLGFKGLTSSARDMYDWALDIASRAYEAGQDPPIDRSTGVLTANSVPVTSNLLTAATSLAVHFAQSGDITSALPAFLSVLRVQRELELPASGSDAALPQEPKNPWGILSKILKDDPYPAPPRSGDLPASRNPLSACHEAGTLAQIGELLYVTPPTSLPKALVSSKPKASKGSIEANPAQEAGLAWARQAVDAAEEALEVLCGRNKTSVADSGGRRPNEKPLSQRLGMSDLELEAAREACAGCLEMAMFNWEQMVAQLAAKERNMEIARIQAAKTGSSPDPGTTTTQSSGGWFSLWRKGELPEAPAGLGDRWTTEANTVVRERKIEIRQLLREERLPIKQL